MSSPTDPEALLKSGVEDGAMLPGGLVRPQGMKKASCEAL